MTVASGISASVRLTTASRYTSIAQTILDAQIEEATPKAALPSSNPSRSQPRTAKGREFPLKNLPLR
ncbi:hypothetical protein ACH34W_51630 [Actinomadura sp. 6N118]